MTLDELFRHSLVINLDTAEDRLALMRRAFSFAGLPMPRRIGACHLRKLEYNPWWRRPPGGRYHVANCSASHLQCIHMAQALGWPFVAVFEDDAWPRRDARAALDAGLADLRPTGCWFPGWCMRREDDAGPAFSGSHAYVVFADAYETFCEAYRADLRQWYADEVFLIYEPLRRVTRMSDTCVFSQMNVVDGAPAYAGLFAEDKGDLPGCWRAFSRNVPQGFPSYEEVVHG